MHRSILATLIVIALTVLGAVIYILLPPSKAGLLAVERLAQTDRFSLGPVTFGGSVPDREDEFFIILHSRHSARLFRDLYERGTPEARFYALCGLYLTHGGFDKYADRFVDETKSIITIELGFANDTAVYVASDAVSLIERHLMESYLPVREEFERGRIVTKYKMPLNGSGNSNTPATLPSSNSIR